MQSQLVFQLVIWQLGLMVTTSLMAVLLNWRLIESWSQSFSWHLFFKISWHQRRSLKHFNLCHFWKITIMYLNWINLFLVYFKFLMLECRLNHILTYYIKQLSFFCCGPIFLNPTWWWLQHLKAPKLQKHKRALITHPCCHSRPCQGHVIV